MRLTSSIPVCCVKRMSIQSIEASSTNKLHLSWKLYAEGIKAISIQISTDAEFVSNRHFLIPPTASSVSLDTGAGVFFYRFGAWLPSGKIEWTGIYGPVPIASEKNLPPDISTTLRVNYTQSITNGVRLHTNKIQKGVYYIEYTTDSSFKASSTHSTYSFDSYSNGYADCMNLHPSLVYSIQIYSIDSIPKDSILQLPNPILLHKQKSLPSTKRTNSQESAGIKAAELVLLQEARERPVRFSSQAEYLTFLTAKAKNITTLHKV
jgi:hypothetical protein